MKPWNLALLALALPLILPDNGYARNRGNDSSSLAESAKPFLGRWDLTLKSSDHEYPSWLELREEDGHLKAEFTSRWGNARPLPKVEISAAFLPLYLLKRRRSGKTTWFSKAT
jgi:hypothetical protein